MKSVGYWVGFIIEIHILWFRTQYYFLQNERKFDLSSMCKFIMSDPAFYVIDDIPISITNIYLFLGLRDYIFFRYEFHEHEMWIADCLYQWFFLIYRSGISRISIWQIVKDPCPFFSFRNFFKKHMLPLSTLPNMYYYLIEIRLSDISFFL